MRVGSDSVRLDECCEVMTGLGWDGAEAEVDMAGGRMEMTLDFLGGTAGRGTGGSDGGRRVECWGAKVSESASTVDA